MTDLGNSAIEKVDQGSESLPAAKSHCVRLSEKMDVRNFNCNAAEHDASEHTITR